MQMKKINKLYFIRVFFFSLFLNALYTNADENEAESYFQKIRTLISQRKLFSIETALELLPTTLKSNFLLQFGSQSDQYASPELPRVIVTSQNARFIMTFTGSDSVRGGKKLEIMKFNRLSAAFDFYIIDFEEKRPRLSKNPESCFKCHSNARPIWHSELGKPLWPTFYGATGHNSELIEAEKWFNFVSQRSHKNRYKFLQNANSRYIDKNIRLPQMSSMFEWGHAEMNYREHEWEVILRNFERKLGFLNAKRIVRKIKILPFYKKYLPALNALILSLVNTRIYKTPTILVSLFGGERNYKIQLEQKKAEIEKAIQLDRMSRRNLFYKSIGISTEENPTQPYHTVDTHIHHDLNIRVIATLAILFEKMGDANLIHELSLRKENHVFDMPQGSTFWGVAPDNHWLYSFYDESQIDDHCEEPIAEKSNSSLPISDVQ